MLSLQYFYPKKTMLIEDNWLAEGTICRFIEQNDTKIKFKPLGKKNQVIGIKDFKNNFLLTNSKNGKIPNNGYYPKDIDIKEFDVKCISLQKIKVEIKPYIKEQRYWKLINKFYKDAHVAPGSSKCITIPEYKEYKNGKKLKNLESIGHQRFNRTTRDTPICEKDREEYIKSLSFPAPLGIRKVDFAFPSEQNSIFFKLLEQLINCKNFPKIPDKILGNLGIKKTVPHVCLGCFKEIDLKEFNQEYSTSKQTLNICHDDPNKRTTEENIYIGHTECNREQGANSKEDIIKKALTILKNCPELNEKYEKELLELVNSKVKFTVKPLDNVLYKKSPKGLTCSICKKRGHNKANKKFHPL
jgi:hypothetical protein